MDIKKLILEATQEIKEEIASGKLKLNEATIVIGTPNGAAPTDSIKKKQAMDATKAGDTVKYVKPGLAEKEDSEPEPEEAPAEEQGNISDKLSQLISQAIDMAGECISSTNDSKYESTLGRVIKNLTAAQDALVKVSEHEAKLSEKVEAETAKNLEKYKKDFYKSLKKLGGGDALVPKIERVYQNFVKAGMQKEKPADKIAEQVWSHFLAEGKR
jgi:hypothetical protein